MKRRKVILDGVSVVAKEYSKEIKDRNIAIALILFLIMIMRFLIGRDIMKNNAEDFKAWIIIFIEIMISILIWIYLIKIEEIDIKSLFRVENIKYILFGYIGLMVISGIFIFIGRKIYGELSANTQFLQQEKISLSGIALFEFSIYGTILGPIIEEFIFRYVMIGNIGKMKNISLIISSIIFSYAHGTENILYWLMYFIAGLIFALIYKKTERIDICILIHILNNAF